MCTRGRVRTVFLGATDHPDGGIVELLDLGLTDIADAAPQTGLPSGGVFLLSFQVDVPSVLVRLDDLGLGGVPRTMPTPRGDLAATVVDPDGATVGLLPAGPRAAELRRTHGESSGSARRCRHALGSKQYRQFHRFPRQRRTHPSDVRRAPGVWPPSLRIVVTTCDSAYTQSRKHHLRIAGSRSSESGGIVADRDKSMAWLPFSIAEAAMSDAGDQPEPPQAWTYLTERLTSSAALVESDPVSRNRIDLAAGMRLLPCRWRPGSTQHYGWTPTRSSASRPPAWMAPSPGAWSARTACTPDPALRAGESYRLHGNRGTARYVGLQTMNGIASIVLLRWSTTLRSTTTGTSR